VAYLSLLNVFLFTEDGIASVTVPAHIEGVTVVGGYYDQCITVGCEVNRSLDGVVEGNYVVQCSVRVGSMMSVVWNTPNHSVSFKRLCFCHSGQTSHRKSQKQCSTFRTKTYIFTFLTFWSSVTGNTLQYVSSYV